MKPTQCTITGYWYVTGYIIVHVELIASRSFESGKGFSINTLLWRGQHKPRGFDARRRDRCANYLAA